MNNHKFVSAILGAIAVTACAPANVATPVVPPETTDAEIEHMFEAYQQAWNTADAAAFGALFTEDAEQLVWNGLHMEGRNEIVEGHEALFAGPAKGSQLKTRIETIKRPAPGVTTVLVAASRSIGTEPVPEEPEAMPFFVVVREDGEPRIAALHNMMLPRAWSTFSGGPPPPSQE